MILTKHSSLFSRLLVFMADAMTEHGDTNIELVKGKIKESVEYWVILYII